MKTSTSVFEKKKVRMTGAQRVKQHEDYPSGSEGLTVEVLIGSSDVNKTGTCRDPARDLRDRLESMP